MYAIVFLVCAGMPCDSVLQDTVDLIEVNHVYDMQGKIVYTQAVFYEWCSGRNEYRVRAWRLLKARGQRPIRDFQRGGWEMIFWDGNRVRKVRATLVRASWTQYDLEQDERTRLAKEYRSGLLYERQTW